MKNFTWSSRQWAELRGLKAAYFSFFASLSVITTESKDAGDKLSSILWTDGWQSKAALIEQLLKETDEIGLSPDLTGNAACEVFTINSYQGFRKNG